MRGCGRAWEDAFMHRAEPSEKRTAPPVSPDSGGAVTLGGAVLIFYVCPKCGHLTHERADCPKCATTGELAYAFTDLDDAIEFRQSIRDARRLRAA